jgi:glutamine synthetase
VLTDRTVAVAVPDAAGRLIGKRLSADTWARVKEAGWLTMPDFHLITGLENVPLPDLPAAGAHRGFRNGVLRPDLSSLRRLPWNDATDLVLCDAYDTNGVPAEPSPRWVLRRQLERLAAQEIVAGAASELEFYLLSSSYADALANGYRSLRPVYHRHGDNDLLVDDVVEPLLGEVRRLMPLADVPIELSQGEGGIGQFEVTLRFTDPLGMADRHVIYKQGVKALAGRRGLAATFMAKLHHDQPGSGCHLHFSMSRPGGENLIDDGNGQLTRFGGCFVAGLLAHASDLCLLFAPYANSYRRLQPGAWAPTSLTWGIDNRTCMVRICGTPGDRRIEFRLPGADANPYLAFAGLIAAGLRGVADGLEPPPLTVGDAQGVPASPLPRDLVEALGRFECSEVAGDALGPEVRDHFAGLARHELDASRRQVTDRELIRGFEVA